MIAPARRTTVAPGTARVLIFAPLGRDATLTAEILGRAGLPTTVCRDAGGLCAGLAKDKIEAAGVLLLTEEALTHALVARLGAILATQPPWSNLPVLLMLSGRRHRGASPQVALLARNLGPQRQPLLLHRPQPVVTVISVVAAALASRYRQHQVRDLLQELAAFNATLEERVQERTVLALDRAEQVRALSADLLLAEEREHRRLAQVLHDDLQQLLLAARMQVETLGRLRDPSQQGELVGQARETLNLALEATRSLTVELSPPVLYERGLAASFAWLAAQTRRVHSGITIVVTAEAADDPKPADLRVFLFRAVRELLLNAVKHAGAAATIGITQTRVDSQDGSRHLRVVVRDDGVGFNPVDLARRPFGTGGFGLNNLRERAAALGGELRVDSTPGQGTTMTILVPLDAPPSRPRRKRSRAVGSTRPSPSVVGG